jgi:hypothetical protein
MGTGAPEVRDGWGEWAHFYSDMGFSYPLTTYGNSTGTTETIGTGFTAYVQGAYQANGVVFACELARMSLFSEGRFQFRRFKDGRPGDLFGNAALIPLHQPWPGGTTGDLMAGMLLDADMAGNAFTLRQGPRLRRLRPDWVTIVYGSGREDSTMWDLDAELLGYLYQEGGPGKGKDPVALLPESVAHFAPVPDPLSPHRGMSWLTPVLREIQADSSFTSHKSAFINNGATVNLTIEYEPEITKELFEFAVQSFKDNHEGAHNAWKTLHLLGGKAHAIGADFQQMDFTAVSNAGAERIIADSGIHPAILGLAGGLQGSSLNQGNFAAARRLTADKCLRPLWRNVAGSLANIIDVPSSCELAVDLRDIAFLREDEKDAAEIQEIQARSITTLVNGGYDPKSVLDAIAADDMTKLVHSGLLSVQLQPPGTAASPPSNGKVLDAPTKVTP